MPNRQRMPHLRIGTPPTIRYLGCDNQEGTKENHERPEGGSMNRTAYIGAQPGSFIIIESPDGLITPPIWGFQMAGGLSDICTQLNYHIRQAEIAELIGVRQQHVSSIINGKWEMA